ncbi:MAG: hypothetical protein FJ109_06170, partial [Deltaproteobacteria bacterium]|nr:hypothetical protein [Deltaproteobacteria bacterium]
MRFWNELALVAVLLGLAGASGVPALADEMPVASLSAPELPSARVRSLARCALTRLAGERGVDSLRVTWPESP